MSIRIVTHCYAKDCPWYAELLRFQLSSLVLFRPKVDVSISVCYSVDDLATVRVIQWFEENIDPSELRLDPEPLTEHTVYPRAIGRNIVARKYYDELIWFTDVDHLFGNDCLDDLWLQWQMFSPSDLPSMVYPKNVRIHASHYIGDAEVIWSANHPDQLVSPDYDYFELMKYKKAIGGVQIVRGSLASNIGYLPEDKKWQKPSETSGWPGRCRDDVIFRRECQKHGPIISLLLPGAYRMRHSHSAYE